MNLAPVMTISKEDYLKAIATAEADDEKVVSATLANWLSVIRPAVTAALKRHSGQESLAVRL